MYSRAQDRKPLPLRLPENYGGCAFSSTVREEPKPPPTPTEAPFHTAEPPSEKEQAPPSPPKQPRLPLSLPLSRGLHFDELLLLGLMLLLSQNREESDLLPLLALLLFCG